MDGIERFKSYEVECIASAESSIVLRARSPLPPTIQIDPPFADMNFYALFTWARFEEPC